MRIALVSPYDFRVPSGVNSHIVQLSNELRRRGHLTTIFAPGVGPSEDENVHLIGRSFPVPSGGSVARVSLSPRAGQWTRVRLEEGQFDIIHVHEPMIPVLPIQFLRLGDAPKVGTFHTARERRSRLYDVSHRVLRRYWRLLDGRITVSPAASRLVTHYFPETYRLIPNGIHIEHFAAWREPPAHITALKPYVLFVGRFEKRKGAEVLLEAFARLREQFRELNLVIVGGGSGRERLEALARDAGAKHVHFAGYVPDDELPVYYQQAEVFCAPNTGNESFGMILLEAMAAGTPIVASRIQGFVDVVNEREDGLLAPPGEPALLADVLARVLNDRDLARSLREQGSKTVQRYSWDVVSEEIISYYLELIGKRQPGLQALTLPYDVRPEARDAPGPVGAP